MNAERKGDGPRAFVGVHGWAGNSHTFRRLYAYMPQEASFYAMDLPGYGETPPPNDWAVAPVLAHIADMVREVASDDITLVCNCGGAQFGLEAVRVHGLPVRRVVLIDPFGYCPWYFRLFTLGTFGRHAYYTSFGNPLGRFFTNNALRRHRRNDTNLTAAFTRVNHEVAHRYMSLMVSLEDTCRFRGLDVGIDVVHGDRTFKAVRNSLAIWREVFPGVRVHELEGAGHEPIREATEQLARIIFDQPCGGGAPSHPGVTP